jgi:transcriptional regulator with XRE-family HTH domain
MAPGLLIREARRNAGLTQRELASRLGTTQSALARLERPDSNPTVETLEEALLATGHRLELRVVRAPAPVDESLNAQTLRLDPAARLHHFVSFYGMARRTANEARRRRGG